MFTAHRYTGVIERYREFLPVTGKTPVVTLLEGATPLIPSRSLASNLGKRLKIYFKFEGLNPTGSFKDRGMTLAVSKSLEAGAKAAICASTGNTSASAAAYAARAGLRCIVVIPEGAIALGKLSQALIHGAQVIAVQGNFDQALGIVRELAQRPGIALVNSLNPHRLEGQKTAAFEIVDELGEAPDVQCMPVGNAGNITAYWKGYVEYNKAGRCRRLPKMFGFQAEGASPLVKGYPIEKPETIATAIRIGNPASWKGALAARDESGGRIESVTDQEILEAYQQIATQEGVFCEPASAASVAGLIRSVRNNWIEEGRTIVCILTGHGLKDPDRALAVSPKPVPLLATVQAVAKAAGL